MTLLVYRSGRKEVIFCFTDYKAEADITDLLQVMEQICSKAIYFFKSRYIDIYLFIYM